MPGFTLARGLPVVGPSCSARGQPCTAQTPARAVRNSLAAGRVGTSLKHGRTAVISSVVRRSSAVCSTANSWEQLAREQQAAKNWWQDHTDILLDIRTAAEWDTELNTSSPNELVVVEWVSPTCKHCLAAQGTIVEAIEAAKDAKLPVKFVRVACDDTETKTLARGQTIRAFPTISMFRSGKKLVEFNPSQRGDAIGRLTNNIKIVATTLEPNKAFQMLSNEVKVIDVEPTPLERAAAAVADAKAAAVPVAAAAAAVAAAVAVAESANESPSNCDEEEECAPTWDEQS